MTLWGFLSWLFRWPLSEEHGKPICRVPFSPAVLPSQKQFIDGLEIEHQKRANELAQKWVDSEAAKVKIHRGFPSCPGNAYDRRQHRRRILRWKMERWQDDDA